MQIAFTSRNILLTLRLAEKFEHATTTTVEEEKKPERHIATGTSYVIRANGHNIPSPSACHKHRDYRESGANSRRFQVIVVVFIANNMPLPHIRAVIFDVRVFPLRIPQRLPSISLSFFQNNLY